MGAPGELWEALGQYFGALGAASGSLGSAPGTILGACWVVSGKGFRSICFACSGSHNLGLFLSSSQFVLTCFLIRSF